MHELYAGRWMRTYTVKTVTTILKRGEKNRSFNDPLIYTRPTSLLI